MEPINTLTSTDALGISNEYRMIDDGGPAFPQPLYPDNHGQYVPSAAFGDLGGMNVRDVFADSAMRSILGAALMDGSKVKYSLNSSDHFECIALDAYAMADAMIKVRGGSK